MAIGVLRKRKNENESNLLAAAKRIIQCHDICAYSALERLVSSWPRYLAPLLFRFVNSTRVLFHGRTVLLTPLGFTSG